jgi:AraC family transcriptional regulator, arabinose operon regulatory protein
LGAHRKEPYLLTVNVVVIRTGEIYPASMSRAVPSRRFTLPSEALEHAQKHPLLRAFIPTRIGIDPNVHGRFESKQGIPQAILLYCARGCGWCELDRARHDVRAGNLLVIPPRTAYAFGADPVRPWTIPWIQVTGENIDLLLKELGATRESPVIDLGDDPQVLALFENAIGVAESATPCTTTKLFHLSQSVGHLLAFINARRRSSGERPPDIHERIKRCIEFMNQKLGEKLELNTLAEFCNLSRTRFLLRFRQIIGVSPMAFLTGLRMERACHLLIETEMPIKEIAIQVGYFDPYWFSNAFRSMYRTSPSEFRDKNRRNTVGCPT